MLTVSREKAKDIMEEGATVVDVLSPAKYQEYHLPGAKNVPLDDQFEAHIQQAVPDKSQEVVVYCMNTDCDASPRAAETMEKLGYTHIYDYEAGKEDWKEAGLPTES